MKNGVFTDPAHADFWRASEDLQLFLLRGYDEDAVAELSPQHSNVQPGHVLDPTLPVWRVGECLMHAERLAQRRKAERVSVEIHWSGLKGRSLSSLTPLRHHWYGGPAHGDSAKAWLSVETEAIAGTLIDLVMDLTAPLFVLFDFFEMPRESIERELDALRGSRPER